MRRPTPIMDAKVLITVQIPCDLSEEKRQAIFSGLEKIMTGVFPDCGMESLNIVSGGGNHFRPRPHEASPLISKGDKDEGVFWVIPLNYYVQCDIPDNRQLSKGSHIDV